MLGASIGLVYEGTTIEGVDQRIIKVVGGLIVGVSLVLFSQKMLNSIDKDYSIGQVTGQVQLKC